ncbi:MAG TPA: AcrB/AcrD/AcrF family protein, partial [Chakrabartia sp.]|nr:AcrB/AcrD/AcrF family protein [Chakrabartia sp.]
IAGLMLLFRLFMSPFDADRWAAALAPLIPLLVIMIGVALTCRRLVHPLAPLPAFVAMIFSAMLMVMVQPLRIDHHNWQLAMVALVMAGLADPDERRGGRTAGLTSAVSLAIGMEMFPYLGLAGAAIALRWVWDGESSVARLNAYGAALAVGTAFGFLLFASTANWAPRCDALTPVWTGAMGAAGVLAVILSRSPFEGRLARLGAAALGGGILAAGFVVLAPQCLSNLEGISPEVKRLWFNNIREVRPVFLQAPASKVPLLANVGIGLIGHGLLLYRLRTDPRLPAALGVAAMALAAALMLMWQGRAGPVAQLLSLPGFAALGVAAGELLFARLSAPLALALLVALTALVGGAGAQWSAKRLPKAKTVKTSAKAADPAKMGRRCSTIPAHTPLNKLTMGKIFTFVDLAPRLITLTRHSSITGPYHRNGDLILDVHQAFRATPERARGIVVDRHHADYVLICPGSPEST